MKRLVPYLIGGCLVGCLIGFLVCMFGVISGDHCGYHEWFRLFGTGSGFNGLDGTACHSIAPFGQITGIASPLVGALCGLWLGVSETKEEDFKEEQAKKVDAKIGTLGLNK